VGVTVTDLASARLCIAQIRDRWGWFQEARRRHLAGVGADRTPSEKVAENILCELFTGVLDWTIEQVRLQEQRVDLMLCRGGLRFLVVEVKRPGSFDGRGSILRALTQARGYAVELKVDRVAVSDGCVFEAYDVVGEGLRPRTVVHLADPEPAEDLWWISTRGIYRMLPATVTVPNRDLVDDGVLHPKYGLPARCFAHVGDPARPSTWKLPYLLADGSVDAKRLPKAIGAVIRDYRMQQVKGLSDEDTGQVLVTLAGAAVRTGRMPHQDPTPAEIYVALLDHLRQIGRAGEVPGLDS
jgi:hypothetical protein